MRDYITTSIISFLLLLVLLVHDSTPLIPWRLGEVVREVMKIEGMEDKWQSKNAMENLGN